MESIGRSPLRMLGARALLWLGALGLGSAACGNSSEPGPAEQGTEAVGSERAALIALEAPTTVESGTPSPRTAKCPGKKLPDQCGTWAGVELSATRTADAKHCDAVSDEHCLCSAIDFQIPAALPVTQGKSGWDWDKAALTFRTTSGRDVECRYRGNGSPGKKGVPIGGDKYLFERCSDGSKPGQTKRADWFELQLDDGHPGWGPTQVELRLGAPDVVDGVVQEQVFYSTDSRIPGAALYVPRGAAPPFETFSLDVVTQVRLGTTIPNAKDPATTVSFAVDIHSDSTDSFVFTRVPGAACARIELPYDQATLERVAGPGHESWIQAQQLTSVSGIASGAQVLISDGPVKVDLARRTFSFCVEHLSVHLGSVSGYSATLSAATIQSTTGPSLPLQSVLGAARPPLTPNEHYELKLSFLNTGASWSAANTSLVAVGAPVGTTVTALAGATTPWGVPVTTPLAGLPLVNGATATFVLDLTSPPQSELLNFCLHRLKPSPAPAEDFFFGECFSWDAQTVTNGGSTRAAVLEICDNVDNDRNGLIDDGITQACYTGTASTQDVGLCHGGTTTCSAGAFGGCVGEVLPTAESCNNLDDNCNGVIDEAVTQACYTGPAPTNGVGVCHGGTQTCNSGAFGGCAGQVLPAAETCNGLDDDCNGLVDEGVTSTFYRDVDGDGYGVAGSRQACSAPDGYVAIVGDCDDSNPAIGLEGSYRADGDGDTWCAPASTMACPGAQPAGTIPSDQCSSYVDPFGESDPRYSDCNDSNAYANSYCRYAWFGNGPTAFQDTLFPFSVDCGTGWHIQSCEVWQFLNQPGEVYLFGCLVGLQTANLLLFYDVTGNTSVDGPLTGDGIVYCEPDATYP